MATQVNADNIQGDILGKGLAKKAQSFVFFQITNGKKFTQDLKKLLPQIKHVEQVVKDRQDIHLHKQEGNTELMEVVGVNVSFTYTGLRAIGISDWKMAGTSLTADGGVFKRGAIRDAASLGDPMDILRPRWDPEFLEQIDGVFLVAGDSENTTAPKVQEVIQLFQNSGSSIRVIRTISGVARPDNREHFGFRDGISNPSIIGFDPVRPGPAQVDAKSILTGYNGFRPDWTADGSFLVFRYLLQKVPEFDTYLKKHALRQDGNGNALTPEQGSELLGARLVGRWKSGAPIEVTPFKDDPELALDPDRNNDFSYAGELHNMVRCPWASHVRRTNPREDSLRFGRHQLDNRKIARRGISFGPEVTDDERARGITEHERGLLFACYQSNIETAFRFIQQAWANNPLFPFTGQVLPIPGLDPIIGQSTLLIPRNMTGMDPSNANSLLQIPSPMPDFVVPRGGVYFWTPSIKTLNELDAIVAGH